VPFALTSAIASAAAGYFLSTSVPSLDTAGSLRGPCVSRRGAGVAFAATAAA
jgi:hypothetical protein